MADELIDLLNDDGSYNQKTLLKSEAHRLGLWHASVHIWLYNKNEIVLQKRAIHKDTYPNLWDISVAGHIGAGELPVESAVRELQEEIGYCTTPDSLIFIETHKASKRPTKSIIDNEFNHIYCCKMNQDLATLRLQKEEVAAIKLLSFAQFEKDINDPKKAMNYVPHGISYYTKILQALKKYMG